MIQIDNLTKSFGNLQVLKGVSLSIKKGEVISIVGPSGAGKTTFLEKEAERNRPFFKNTSKTSSGWGVRVRVTVNRNGADGACYITAIGGNFE